MNTAELVRLMHRVIDERLDLALPPGAPRSTVVRGRVAQQSGRRATVALDGSAVLVQAIVPAIAGEPLVAGDVVECEQRSDGRVTVQRILGRTGEAAASGDHDHDADYQPLDSDLTSIAALTTTSFGRAVLALADAEALRDHTGIIAYSTLMFAGLTLPATGSADFNPDTTTSLANHRLLHDGTVIGLSVSLSAARTSGTIEFRCETAGSTLFGPTATIGPSDTQFVGATAAIGSGGNTFTAGTRFHIDGTVTTGTISPTTADVIIAVTVAYTL